MNWQKLILQLRLPAGLIEEISDALTAAGALSVTLEAAEHSESEEAIEAIFEPSPGTAPLWEQVRLSALFEETVDLKQVLNFLHALNSPNILNNPNILGYQVETLAEQNWQKTCEDAFPPRCFGDKLWICPSWHDVPATDQPHVILDPGLAFGTGAHPTTALCLEWLAQFIQPEDSVIDYE